MTSSVRERDNGHRALLARLEAPKGTVTVGIHEAEGGAAAEGGGELTVLDVANLNEFGTTRIPARSFIGAWFDETFDRNQEDVRKSSEAVIKGELPSMRVALERLGLKFVGDVQTRIKAGIDPPNAESTIAAKGSSTPLIDTGQLWTSIRHQVSDQ